MGYSDDLDVVINQALKDLIDDYKNHAFMFDKEKNEEYLKLYLNLKIHIQIIYLVKNLKHM